MILAGLLIGILILLGSKLLPPNSLWPILFGGFILIHFWVMARGHGSHAHEYENKDEKDAHIRDSANGTGCAHEEHADKKQNGGGCCH